MCLNAGKTDRIIRAIVGIVIIAYGFYAGNYIIAGIGFIPLITGILGFCPFYSIFKLDTGCKKK